MSTKRPRWYGWMIHAVVVALCVLVLLLARENRRLEDLLRSSSLDNVEAGEPFPGFAATGLDGRETWLRFDDSPRESILLFFTTTCPTCEQNVGNWLDLYEQAAGHYELIAVGIDEPALVRDYAAKHALPFDVYVPVDWRYFPKAYRISTVPQTIVVDRDGQVRDVQVGLSATDFLDRVARRVSSIPASS